MNPTSPTSPTSARTESLEIALRDNLTLEKKMSDQTKAESAGDTLRRLLSMRTVVSTSSSFAERQQQAVNTEAMLREIGTGSIGKVFEHPGTVYVYKLPLLDDSKKLWNNYVINLRVQTSFDQCPYVNFQAEVPRGFWFANGSSEAFWGDFIDRFPFDNQFPRKKRSVFCMERIFPLPLPVRNGLIEKFVPKENWEMVKASAANKDCLVRPILGREKFGSSGRFFSLRNFKLHVDQVQELGLNAIDLASAMGHAMAVLHWHTRIDACDIEFVLGSSPQQEQAVRGAISLEKLSSMPVGSSTFEQITHKTPNFRKRVISLWILDFDACRDITFDKNGVEQAVKAFFDTEPYCPRPTTDNDFRVKLWHTFSEAYLKYGTMILKSSKKKSDLAELFIKGVEDYIKQRQSTPRADRPSSGGLRDIFSGQSPKPERRSPFGGQKKDQRSGGEGSWRGSPSRKHQGKK